MLLYTFDGYEGFKELFGLREHGNGITSRRNTILLAFYKSPKVIQYAHHHNLKQLLSITSMAQLKVTCLAIMEHAPYWQANLELNGHVWFSPLYKTDHMKGKTMDGDAKSIRYVRQDTGKVYKMKAGKMYRHLILETEFGRCLPEQVVTWLCEELAQEWGGYNTAEEYTLHVDKDFEKIYSRNECAGNFHSCMTDEDHHSFYEDAVNCSAAYITSPEHNDKIVARAVIYNKVYDENGNCYRLCERQYSVDCDDMLKQILVNKLIEGGFIDGYKRIGADCHNSRGFVDCKGNDMSELYLHIKCSLDFDDTISYQDSFKWYNMERGESYNFEPDKHTYDLATTSRYIDDDRNYDEYHQEYTSSDIVRVHYDGHWISCSEDWLDDFTYINGAYYHNDETSYCDRCDEYYLDEDGYYSEVTGDSYCCKDCQNEAEIEYCEENPDEYVWFQESAVPVDEVIVCAQCGDIVWLGEEEASIITDADYCCEECRDKAERRYIDRHPECDWAICEDCDEIHPKEEMILNEDGVYQCAACHKIAANLSEIA